jgi:hypothetical protein
VAQNPFNIYAGFDQNNMPENQSYLLAPDMLHAAHEEFRKREVVPENLRANKLVVVMIVQPDERNRIEQRHIEYELIEHHSVPLIRASLYDIATFGSLSEADNHLVL